MCHIADLAIRCAQARSLFADVDVDPPAQLKLTQWFDKAAQSYGHGSTTSKQVKSILVRVFLAHAYDEVADSYLACAASGSQDFA